MKSAFKQNNLPFVLLILMFIKSLFMASPVFDATAILVLSGLFGFKLWLDYIKKPDFNQDVIEMVEANRKYLDDKIEEMNIVHKDNINKIDGKLSAYGLNVAQKQQSKTNFKW